MDRRSLRVWISGLLVLVIWAAFSQCNGPVQKAGTGAVIIGTQDSLPKDLAVTDTAYGNASEKAMIVVLVDGSAVRLGPHSVIRMAKTFNKTDREVRLDGSAAFTIGQFTGKPFIVHTRNLKITVLDNSRFWVDAFALNAGEEADVTLGKLLVTKSYHSTTDNEPETLGRGEMVMINRDIDLMEKETLKPDELKAVQEKW